MTAAAARFASALLIAGLAVLCAHWFWRFAAPSVRATTSAPGADAAGMLAAIDAGRLFGGAGAGTPGAVQRDVALRGIYASTRRRDAFVVLVLDGKTSVTARTGEEFAAGARVERIARDHVMISRGGIAERLELDTRRPAPGTGAPPGTRGAR